MVLSVDAPALGAEARALFQRVAEACARHEGVRECGAYVTITDDEGIRAVNREQRGVDAATDVLSFPAARYPKGKTAGACPKLISTLFDDAMGAHCLGEIIISWPRVKAQARAYGHGEAREAAYLLAHGLYHIMGYDHENDKEKQIMRDMEEDALREAGAPRVTDEELLDKAREALLSAYAPYSRFRVGACILTDDGRLFTGCNIENASYGLTICAERCAVCHAVCAGAKRLIAIAVAAERAMPWPCGACRQVLREFGAADARVLVTYDGKTLESTLGELMPHTLGEDEGDPYFLGKD